MMDNFLLRHAHRLIPLLSIYNLRLGVLRAFSWQRYHQDRISMWRGGIVMSEVEGGVSLPSYKLPL